MPFPMTVRIKEVKKLISENHQSSLKSDEAIIERIEFQNDAERKLFIKYIDELYKNKVSSYLCPEDFYGLTINN